MKIKGVIMQGVCDIKVANFPSRLQILFYVVHPKRRRCLTINTQPRYIRLFGLVCKVYIFGGTDVSSRSEKDYCSFWGDRSG